MDQVKTGRLKGRKKYQKQMQKLKETEEVWPEWCQHSAAPLPGRWGRPGIAACTAGARTASHQAQVRLADKLSTKIPAQKSGDENSVSPSSGAPSGQKSN
jgi:hypothetical protein